MSCTGLPGIGTGTVTSILGYRMKHPSSASIKISCFLERMNNTLKPSHYFIPSVWVLAKFMPLFSSMRHVVTFIDVLPHMIWTYLMKDQSELSSIFVLFRAENSKSVRTFNVF